MQEGFGSRGVLRRRVLQGMAAGLLAPSAWARARRRRIGVFSPDPFTKSGFVKRVGESLAARGFREGVEVEFLFRETADDIASMKEQAAELVALRPDVILTLGARRTRVLAMLTATIPIVTQASDPVAQGFAATLAKPGGNVTGYTINSPELWVKGIEAVRRMDPRLGKLADMSYSRDPERVHHHRTLVEIGTRLRLAISDFSFGNSREAESAFSRLAGGDTAAILPSEIFHRAVSLAEAARRARTHRVPTISIGENTVRAGLLVAHTPHWDRLDYGVVGQVNNLAARLCGEAAPGQILVAQRVMGRLEGRLEAEAVGPLALKGIHAPVPACSVLSMRPARAGVT